MAKHNETAHVQNHGSAKVYVIGFVLSIIFTIIPFIMVQNAMLPKIALVAGILIFAVLQLFVQLFFFMHFNEESKPRLHAQAFWFAILCLFIIVGGSAWVMFELAYYMGM
jgi:cytochrome o ubiquinol oxidase operon protein cyoD